MDYNLKHRFRNEAGLDKRLVACLESEPLKGLVVELKMAASPFPPKHEKNQN